MNNLLKITDVVIEEKRIEVSYEAFGEWIRIFNQEEKFYVEYISNISKTPKSIAVIPILGTFLTLTWLFDAKLVVPELDEDFYNAIPEIKKGYQTMYPHLELKGTVEVEKIVKNEGKAKGSAQLFSGGADAFCTLFEHIEEKPKLISVWGADIQAKNEEGWEVVRQHIENTAKKFNLEYELIKSNFREILSSHIHSEESLRKSGDGLWHGFQSGTGMLTLVAPYAFCRKVDKLYIASSFTQEQWGTYTCSSDPVIDNEIRFCGCQVFHDGYELNRQQKIGKICNFARVNDTDIPLRVCWESTGGKNCCRCEKCHRTMIAIYAEREDPSRYGFCGGEEFREVIQKLKNEKIREHHLYNAQRKMRINYKKREVIKELRWIYKGKFQNTARYYLYVEENPSFKEKLYWLMVDVLRKIFPNFKNN